MFDIEERRDRVEVLIKQGVTRNAIAELLGVSYQTVESDARVRGAHPPRPVLLLPKKTLANELLSHHWNRSLDIADLTGGVQ